jgi:hypothetical protein
VRGEGEGGAGVKAIDKKLIGEFDLYEFDIKYKTHDCGNGERGDFILERVINRADVPYSIIVCRKCDYELLSAPTEREEGLLAYTKELFEEASNA